MCLFDFAFSVLLKHGVLHFYSVLYNDTSMLKMVFCLLFPPKKKTFKGAFNVTFLVPAILFSVIDFFFSVNCYACNRR